MKLIALIMFLLVSNWVIAQKHKAIKYTNHNQPNNSFLGDTLNMLATKFVMIDKDGINNVDHNYDGTWNFFSNGRSYVPETTLKKVQFHSLLKLDSSILRLSKMPRGYYARRKTKNTPWKIEKFKVKL